MNEITMSGAHGLRVGDRVRFSRVPNSHHSFVDRVTDATGFAFVNYVRPSKGKRRHIRRAKAAARKSTQ